MALCISNERKYSSSIESSVSLSNELQQPLRTIRYVFTLALCNQTEAMDGGNKLEAVEVIRGHQSVEHYLHKAIVQNFHFGCHFRSLEGQTPDSLMLLFLAFV